jgi:hypothetical protein
MKDVATARDIEACIQQPTKGIGPLQVNQAAKPTGKTSRARVKIASCRRRFGVVIVDERVFLLRLRECDLELNADLRH